MCIYIADLIFLTVIDEHVGSPHNLTGDNTLTLIPPLIHTDIVNTHVQLCKYMYTYMHAVLPAGHSLYAKNPSLK